MRCGVCSAHCNRCVCVCTCCFPFRAFARSGLATFEMVVAEVADCLERLVEEDEELHELLLDFKTDDAHLVHMMNDEIQFMLENYHRRFQLIGHQGTFLKEQVTSTQEVAAIRMDVARNRIIRTNLQLSMAGVSIAVVTAISGFFGMNLEPFPFLEEGREPDLGSLPFVAVTAGSCFLGSSIYALTMAHANGESAMKAPESYSASPEGWRGPLVVTSPCGHALPLLPA